MAGLRKIALLSFGVAVWVAVLPVLFFLRINAVLEPCEISSEPLPCSGASFTYAPENPVRFGQNLGIFVLGYVCQMNVLAICNEVSNATPRRFDAIVIIAHIICGLLIVCTAFFGYATYGAAVHSNMLLSYPQDTIMVATRLSYFLVVVIMYTIQAHPCRSSAWALWEHFLARRGSGLVPARPRRSNSRFLEEPKMRYLTAAILLFTLTVALLVDDLGLVYSLVGGVGSPAVTYVIPGLFYTRRFPEAHVKRSLALCLMALGCVFMVVCPAMVLLL